MSRNNYIAFALIYGILFIFNLLFPPQADDLGFYFSAKEAFFWLNLFRMECKNRRNFICGIFCKIYRECFV